MSTLLPVPAGAYRSSVRGTPRSVSGSLDELCRFSTGCPPLKEGAPVRRPLIRRGIRRRQKTPLCATTGLPRRTDRLRGALLSVPRVERSPPVSLRGCPTGLGGRTGGCDRPHARNGAPCGRRRSWPTHRIRSARGRTRGPCGLGGPFPEDHGGDVQPGCAGPGSRAIRCETCDRTMGARIAAASDRHDVSARLQMETTDCLERPRFRGPDARCHPVACRPPRPAPPRTERAMRAMRTDTRAPPPVWMRRARGSPRISAGFDARTWRWRRIGACPARDTRRA